LDAFKKISFRKRCWLLDLQGVKIPVFPLILLVIVTTAACDFCVGSLCSEAVQKVHVVTRVQARCWNTSSKKTRILSKHYFQ